ncbi:MAG: flagellar export protein FliJ [Candidatus Scalinduaceae bacterium]
MQKYHFKLQPLLDKELIYEDKCVRSMKKLQDEFLDTKDKLEKLVKHVIKYQKELKIKKEHQISPSELKLYEDYFLRLDKETINRKYTLKENKKKLETAQTKLLKIVKRRKALEKLKERGMEEHRNNLALLLNKEMDDIAMLKFINSRGVNAIYH